MPKRTPYIATTDAEIDAAIARGKRHSTPYAVAAEYDRETDRVEVHFVVPALGQPLVLLAPRGLFQGLERATKAELAQIELEGGGTGIVWPALDVAHYVPGLLAGIFGTARWMATLNGRRGGRSKSLAKRRAARKNGKKGGRPRGTKRRTPVPA